MSFRYLFIAATMVLGLLISKTSLAEQIYKWVDEQGKTHYSQQNPADKKAVSMHIDPKDGPHVPDESMEKIKRMAQELEERDKKERAARDKAMHEREKRAAIEKENKRRQKEADDGAVEDCRRNHRTYCHDIERLRAESRKKKK